MNALLAFLFAFLASIGNAMFALGQRRAASVQNGLVFVAVTALLTAVLAFAAAPLFGSFGLGQMLRQDGKALILASVGSFLTFLGLNLLFSRFGVSPYVLYAMLAIITTTLLVGMVYLHEPVNAWKIGAVVLALVSVVLYSIGSSHS